jgi:glutathione S-transferase
VKLLIGNRNYSSWSLRPWLVLAELGIPFEEEALSFNDPGFDAKVSRHSPAGRVPLLIDDDGTVVWDSLAIVEYLAERFPDRGVWPADARARAFARSICAEMHSGFTSLREGLPMNVTARLPGRGWSVRVQEDVDRITEIWRDARARFGGAGRFLFGPFSAADAFYAPVATRFVTYDVALSGPAAEYVAAIVSLPSMKRWTAAAAAERDFVEIDEPYRVAPRAQDA